MIESVAGVIKIGMEMINKFIPDPKAKEEATRELFRMEQEGELKEMALKANILMAEANSESEETRSWRPRIMKMFGWIIFLGTLNNIILLPYLQLFGLPVTPVKIPVYLWHLLELGIGGYVVGRSAEKISLNYFNSRKKQ